MWMVRVAWGAAMAFTVGGLGCCSPDHRGAHEQANGGTRSSLPPVTPIPMPALGEATPREYPGIHNAVTYHEGFVSGSAPEGDAGFETLRAMGVKTIISVDGTAPEADKAAAHGLRYIHLPIQYNGFDEERKLQMVRAARDAMEQGPVYIHCHHGKHRSACAAATIATSLGWETPEEGVATMKISGTAPNYTGLFACAAAARKLDASAIDAVPGNFPAVWKPSGYVQGMIEIDEAFDDLKAIEKAGWTTPQDHPDLVPAAEAGRLADLFRDLHELDYVKHKPSDLGSMMKAAGTRAQGLEDLLAAGEKDTKKLGAQLKLVGSSCTECHAKYRDR